MHSFLTLIACLTLFWFVLSWPAAAVVIVALVGLVVMAVYAAVDSHNRTGRDNWLVGSTPCPIPAPTMTDDEVAQFDMDTMSRDHAEFQS